MVHARLGAGREPVKIFCNSLRGLLVPALLLLMPIDRGLLLLGRPL